MSFDIIEYQGIVDKHNMLISQHKETTEFIEAIENPFSFNDYDGLRLEDDIQISVNSERKIRGHSVRLQQDLGMYETNKEIRSVLLDGLYGKKAELENEINKLKGDR